MENIQQELKFGAQTVDVEVVTVSGPPAASVRETQRNLALRAPLFRVESDPAFGEFVVNGRDLHRLSSSGRTFSKWWEPQTRQHKLVENIHFIRDDHNMLRRASAPCATHCVGTELWTPYLTLKAAIKLVAVLKSEKGEQMLEYLTDQMLERAAAKVSTVRHLSHPDGDPGDGDGS